MEVTAMSHHYSGPDFSFPPGDASRSIIIMDMHPSAGVNPPGPTTTEPFAPGALYELKIDTDGDSVADISYTFRFSGSASGDQTMSVQRVEGSDAAGVGRDGAGQVLVGDALVSAGPDARISEAGDHRFFAGWRSDPFFFDAGGALNNFQFTGEDFFADKDVCSIVIELPNSELGF